MTKKNINKDKNLNISYSQTEKDITEVDFDISMGMYDSHCYPNYFKTDKNRSRYTFFRDLYNQNKPSRIVSDKNIKIPKIIHQIWVGPNLFPENRKKLSLQWQALHPDWEYKLWTDKEVSLFDFSLRDIYDESTNYGQMADILRYEILHRYGGLYLDVDFECLRNFNELNTKYHFYAGLHPPHAIIVPNHPLEIGNALIGASPKHPIIEETIKMVRERWRSIKDSKKYDDNWKVIISTMYPLRDAIIKRGKDEKFLNIAFPATYFFPTLPHKTRYLNDPSPGPAFSQVKPESIAVHHWDESWFHPLEQNDSLKDNTANVSS